MEKWLGIFAKQLNLKKIKNGQFSFFDILQLQHTVISNSEKLTHPSAHIWVSGTETRLASAPTSLQALFWCSDPHWIWDSVEREGDMSDLRIVLFLKFVRFGANFAQTVVSGYSLMKKSWKVLKLKIRPLKGQFSGLT